MTKNNIIYKTGVPHVFILLQIEHKFYIIFMYTWGNNKFCAISLMKSPAAGRPFM